MKSESELFDKIKNWIREGDRKISAEVFSEKLTSTVPSQDEFEQLAFSYLSKGEEYRNGVDSSLSTLIGCSLPELFEEILTREQAVHMESKAEKEEPER